MWKVSHIKTLSISIFFFLSSANSTDSTCLPFSSWTLCEKNDPNYVSLHNLRFLPNNHFIFIDSSVARYVWSSFTIGRAKAGTSGNTEDEPQHSHGGFCVPCIEIRFEQQKISHLSISPSFEISGIFIHLRIGRNKSQFSA